MASIRGTEQAMTAAHPIFSLSGRVFAAQEFRSCTRSRSELPHRSSVQLWAARRRSSFPNRFDPLLGPMGREVYAAQDPGGLRRRTGVRATVVANSVMAARQFATLRTFRNRSTSSFRSQWARLY
jgi:hypothetical protein